MERPSGATDQLDVAKLIRVKAAIDATLASSKEATDAPGLSRAYISHRREVASMLEAPYSKSSSGCTLRSTSGASRRTAQISGTNTARSCH
jgi:hypothetical protein